MTNIKETKDNDEASPKSSFKEQAVKNYSIDLTACSFTCPLPPSLNKAYKNTKWGRAYTESAKQWKDIALTNLKAQKINPVSGYCTIVYGFERKSLLSDVTNRLKLIEDIIVKSGIIEDDRFVTATALSWIPYANELAHVSIYPIGPIGLKLLPASDGAHAVWVQNAPQ